MNSFGRFIGTLVALLLIFTGVILLLGNLGFLVVDPVELIVDFWPVFLIIIGLYFIWLRLRPARKPKAVTLSEGIGGAAKARINVDFGAGELRINPLRQGDNVFEGTFRFEADKLVDRAGDTVNVTLRRSRRSYPLFSSRYADDWRIGLTTKIPLSLRLNTGASRVFVDLIDNNVELVELYTGASDVALQLPRASGYTRVKAGGGATNIKLDIPQGVAARIKTAAALSSLRVDEKRFPKVDSGFASPDFESAQNKVDIEISTGVSSVTIS
ncbi:MAG TPA: DUF5668 domain-containing protein [Anaerolineae bacterium]|jgi:hypothetical protein|nr:DUF5668 domain-containing protein [Anaerolineae bacterium]